jgi:hypothetical protein
MSKTKPAASRGPSRLSLSATAIPSLSLSGPGNRVPRIYGIHLSVIHLGFGMALAVL